MTTFRIQRLAGLGVALCAGLMLSLAAGRAAEAAPRMSDLQRLIDSEDLRNRIAQYGFLADGDGPGGSPRNLRVLADTLMTPDVVTEIYYHDGSPPRIFSGRDRVAASPPEVDEARAKRIAGRHYLVSTSIDELTPTHAQTRTSAVYFDATKVSGGKQCTEPGEHGCIGFPVKTIMWVYHMTWKKTPQGWQISKNVLRDDN